MEAVSGKRGEGVKKVRAVAGGEGGNVEVTNTLFVVLLYTLKC